VQGSVIDLHYKLCTLYIKQEYHHRRSRDRSSENKTGEASNPFKSSRQIKQAQST